MADYPIGIDIPSSRSATPRASISSLTSPINTTSNLSRSAISPALSSSSNNPFENFSVPAIPPRLSRVGRRISEIGMNVLAGTDFDDEPPSSRRESGASSATKVEEDVPGMGDEPIMCPFCNKPLPPALIISQMAHNHAHGREKKRTQEVERKVSIRRPSEMGRASPLPRLTETPTSGQGQSVPMSATASAPSSAVQLTDSGAMAGIGKGLPGATLQSRSTSALADFSDVSPLLDPTVPKATADSLLPSVKAGETTDTAAAASIISPEDVKKWSAQAGINLTGGTAPSSTATATIASPAQKVDKPIPTLPPPPPPASTAAERLKKTERSGSGSSSRFGSFFGRNSPTSKADGDSDDEEDYAGTGGYAKLDAPPSPDREEAPVRKTERRMPESPARPRTPAADESGKGADKGVEAGVEGVKVEPVQARSTPTLTSTANTPAAAPVKEDAELRKLLTEVLGKVNVMSKTHEDLLHSHTTLLTSLKIARSNLAMAEANTEMLEEQVKRASQAALKPAASALPAPAAVQPGAVRPAPSRSSASAGGAVPPLPIPQRSSTMQAPPSIVVSPNTVRKSLDEKRPIPLPAALPRKTSETRRPVSMIIPPPNIYNTGPTTGPASSRSSETSSKGMFGFLGGKTKLPGGLGTINIPSAKELQASAAKFGDSWAGPPMSRPQTPSGERTPGGANAGGQFFDFHVPSAYGPVLNVPQDDPSLAGGPPRSRGPSRPTTPNSGAPTKALPVPSGSAPPSAISPSSAGGGGGGASPLKPGPSLARPQPIPPAIAAELSKLRSSHTAAVTQIQTLTKELAEVQKTRVAMDGMSKELTELKKGKIEMEAELESLSQALFEEANKMVADERRRRVEVEESLKEVKEEREALKQTIKVLGGSGASKEEPTPNEAIIKEKEEKKVVQPGQAAKEQENDNDDNDDDKADDWRPRDLDKHYAALRKTIHHVADGTGPSAAFSLATSPETARVLENPPPPPPTLSPSLSLRAMDVLPVNPRVVMSPALPAPPLPGGFMTKDQESNPWAEVDFAGTRTGATDIPGGMTRTYSEPPTMPGLDEMEELDPLSPSVAKRGGAA